jgi:dTDP-4-amino-4,6-dideoxygalactose transaminase
MKSKFSNFIRIIKEFNLNFFFKLFIILLKRNYSKYPIYVEDFESSLSKKFNSKHCLTFSSGTAAFYASLISLNLKKNSNILISSLTFPSVIKTLKKFDFNIYYFDIDKNFEIISKNIKNQKFDLLVMTYPYGFYINPEILKKHLNKDAKTILDASHSQGMKINNIDHVNFFDISFISLQGNKSISGGEGGVILTDNENFYLSMINNHHPGHLKNSNFDIAGGINDLKLRMHPIAALIATNDLKFFEKRNQILKDKIKIIYDYLEKLGVNHPYNSSTTLSGFHFGIPFFFSQKIQSDIIKSYNWYSNLSLLNLNSISQENNEIFFKDLHFIDLEWIKKNSISDIKKKISLIFKDAS